MHVCTFDSLAVARSVFSASPTTLDEMPLGDDEDVELFDDIA